MLQIGTCFGFDAGEIIGKGNGTFRIAQLLKESKHSFTRIQKSETNAQINTGRRWNGWTYFMCFNATLNLGACSELYFKSSLHVSLGLWLTAT